MAAEPRLERVAAFDAGGPITCHCWNADGTLLAVCPNTPEIHIYEVPKDATGGGAKDASEWRLVWKLEQHELVVSGVDWAPAANRIVTGSHDGNAYVWEQKRRKRSKVPEAREFATFASSSSTPSQAQVTWHSTQVVLRDTRAVLSAAWSPSEAKFAVSSASKTASVCHFDSENNWWISKVIKKKHTSSVTSVAWHPNSLLLATTSTDFKCRIFSAYIKGVDPKPSSQSGDGFLPGKFGEELVALDLAAGWAYCAAWSSSGMNLVYTSHDSTIQFINNVGPTLSFQSLPLQNLPLKASAFLSDTIVVSGGWDCQPYVFHRGGPNAVWSLAPFTSAMQLPASSRAHGAPITSIRALNRPDFSGRSFSTVGLDGKLVLWSITDTGAANVDASPIRPATPQRAAVPQQEPPADTPGLASPRPVGSGQGLGEGTPGAAAEALAETVLVPPRSAAGEVEPGLVQDSVAPIGADEAPVQVDAENVDSTVQGRTSELKASSGPSAGASVSASASASDGASVAASSEADVPGLGHALPLEPEVAAVREGAGAEAAGRSDALSGEICVDIVMTGDVQTPPGDVQTPPGAVQMPHSITSDTSAAVEAGTEEQQAKSLEATRDANTVDVNQFLGPASSPGPRAAPTSEPASSAGKCAAPDSALTSSPGPRAASASAPALSPGPFAAPVSSPGPASSPGPLASPVPAPTSSPGPRATPSSPSAWAASPFAAPASAPASSPGSRAALASSRTLTPGPRVAGAPPSVWAASPLAAPAFAPASSPGPRASPLSAPASSPGPRAVPSSTSAFAAAPASPGAAGAAADPDQFTERETTADSGAGTASSAVSFLGAAAVTAASSTPMARQGFAEPPAIQDPSMGELEAVSELPSTPLARGGEGTVQMDQCQRRTPHSAKLRSPQGVGWGEGGVEPSFLDSPAAAGLMAESNAGSPMSVSEAEAAAHEGFSGPTEMVTVLALEAQVQELRSPLAQPPTGSPFAQPPIASPLSEPHKDSPLVQPPMGSPLSQPQKASPLAQPLKASPLSQPPIASRLSDPHKGSPLFQPPIGSPVPEPHKGSPLSIFTTDRWPAPGSAEPAEEATSAGATSAGTTSAGATSAGAPVVVEEQSLLELVETVESRVEEAEAVGPSSMLLSPPKAQGPALVGHTPSEVVDLASALEGTNLDDLPPAQDP